MSLTGVSPLITDWMRLKLKWMYRFNPVISPFTLRANSQLQIPTKGYTFKAPEGILLTFSAGFDHPSCGIRFEAHPNLDTAEGFTVATLLAGFVNFPIYVTAIVPPMSIPGVYGIAQQKEWPWKEWTKLYLINTDDVDHLCLAYVYTMATLEEPRPAHLEGR